MVAFKMTELQPFKNFGFAQFIFQNICGKLANPKFPNRYKSVTLKAIIMKFLPRIQNCGLSLKMPKNRKKYFGNIFKKILLKIAYFHNAGF